MSWDALLHFTSEAKLHIVWSLAFCKSSGDVYDIAGCPEMPLSCCIVRGVCETIPWREYWAVARTLSSTIETTFPWVPVAVPAVLESATATWIGLKQILTIYNYCLHEIEMTNTWEVFVGLTQSIYGGPFKCGWNEPTEKWFWCDCCTFEGTQECNACVFIYVTFSSGSRFILRL